MQNGSIMRSGRQKRADVWEFRWREPGPDGKRKPSVRLVAGRQSQDSLMLLTEAGCGRLLASSKEALPINLWEIRRIHACLAQVVSARAGVRMRVVRSESVGSTDSVLSAGD